MPSFDWISNACVKGLFQIVCKKKKKKLHAHFFISKVLIYLQNLRYHIQTQILGQQNTEALEHTPIFTQLIRASKPGNKLKSSGDRHDLHRQTLICLSK